MGKIYNCVRMKCKTLYQQIHALFSMGSELEDAVTSDTRSADLACGYFRLLLYRLGTADVAAYGAA